MQTILIVFHLFLAVGLIGLILIQHGKGADMGAAFGSGASGTVFGAKGSGSFLTRLTAGLATLFFITSMAMAYFAAQRDDKADIFAGMNQPQKIEVTAPSQGDMPPTPASGSGDMPPVPAPNESNEVPPVTTLENTSQAVTKPDDAVEAPIVETPAEGAPAVEGKEQ